MTLKQANSIIAETVVQYQCVTPNADGHYPDSIKLDYLEDMETFAKKVNALHNKYLAKKTKVSSISYNKAAGCIEVDFILI